MVDISIICLIYKSSKLADMVYDSVIKYTPKLKEGIAEFFFIANDPTPSLVEHLKKKKYPFYINNNKILTEKQLSKLGYGKPEYIRRVYRGYNFGIMKAKGKKIVLINSDNFFSEDWLENLLKYSEYKNVVSSTLIEPGHKTHGIFPEAIQKDFGDTTENYDNVGFQLFAKKIKKTGIKLGGAYMPCLLYKEAALLAGLYPEGNIKGESFDEIITYGDEFFYHKLALFGIKHITSKDSIVYHLKEGEKDEKTKNDILFFPKKEQLIYNNFFNIKNKNLNINLLPIIEHQDIINSLLTKITVIIYDYDNQNDLFYQIDIFQNQAFNNIEIIVIISKDTKFENTLKNKYSNIKIVQNVFSDLGTSLYNAIYLGSGTYYLFANKNNIYDNYFINENIKYNDNDVVYIAKHINKFNIDKDILDIGVLFINRKTLLNYMYKWLEVIVAKKGVLLYDFQIDSNQIVFLSDYNTYINENNNTDDKKNKKGLTYLKRLFNSFKENGIISTGKLILKKCKRR